MVLGANGTLSVFWYKAVASVAYLWIPCHLISSDGFSVQEQLIDGTFSESEYFALPFLTVGLWVIPLPVKSKVSTKLQSGLVTDCQLHCQNLYDWNQASGLVAILLG